MLAASGPPPEEPATDALPRSEPADPVAGPAPDARSAGSGNAGGPGAGPSSAGQGAGREPEGVGPGGQGMATGTGAPSAGSLLAALSQRLAWSAERCAPAALVRIARRAVPGVPVHFCLDAEGRPSGVGLLGTTGSDELDRAARDCVVPGALPLPPAPGCYTVEVRFPIRG
jgi:outer membrane biosynthesis protein TonB